jgi:hypothetical protein
MDKYIIINVNMFTLNNQVCIIGPDEEIELVGTYSLELLPEIISELAHERDVYNVKIAGGAKYSQLLEYGIETTENLKYNVRKIKVEVI